MLKKLLSLALLCGALAIAAQAQPLSVCAANPRYFCKAGVPVLLSGSHTWDNLFDMNGVFDFNAYLNFMQAQNHNLMRLWTWEQRNVSLNGYQTGVLPVFAVGPEYPFAFNGSQFDLSQPNPAFFQRIRNRVIDAGLRDIYVSVMLFEGWELQNDGAHWNSHPFSATGNVNGINADANGDGKGLEAHTLTVPNVNAIQAAYVDQLILAINDLDNVLYEVANESHANSIAWQYAMIDHVHAFEATLPKHHPVGQVWTYGAENNVCNAVMFNGPADWVGPGFWNSPGCGDYYNNPPASTGQKVVIADTDHIRPMSVHGAGWVWKSFLRGLNPLFMDGYLNKVLTGHVEPEVRQHMGVVRSYSQRVNLLETIPQNSRASSGYCLCSETEFLSIAFAPNGNKFAAVTISNLPAGTYAVEWLRLPSATTFTSTVVHAGGNRTFTAPVNKTTFALFVQQQ